MRVTPVQISADALAYEQQRTADFFRLLYIAEKRQLVAPHAVNSIDWSLASSCLDEINYRYADMAFLATLSACALLSPPPPPTTTSTAAATAGTTTTTPHTRHGRRHAGGARRRVLRGRHWYMALFAYNAALTLSAPSPAMTYWNAVCMLASDMGNMARTLHAPTVLCMAVPTRGVYAPAALPVNNDNAAATTTSATAAKTATGGSGGVQWAACVRTLGELVVLRQLFAHVFDGTCWRHRSTATTPTTTAAAAATTAVRPGHDRRADELTALTISNRFMRWNVLSVRSTEQLPGVVEYNAHITLLPRLRVSRSLRRAYACRGLILEKSSLGARWWYATHFAVMRMLGLHAS